VKGRFWLIAGAIVGVAVAAGHLPYLAGAGRSLAAAAERLVGSGADRLIRAVASTGAPERVVLGLSGVVAALLPGVTALLLIVAARSTLRVRALVGLLVVALGAATYVYQPNGKATGALLLALAVAAIAVTLTGPLVAAPLAAMAGLIGGEFLPALARSGQTLTQRSVNDLHQALYGHPGTPTALRLAALVIAAIPFAAGARLILWR
jgi:hypothetical protein